MLRAGALVLVVGLAGQAPAARPPARPAGTACADLAALAIPDVTISSAALVEAGPFTPSGSRRPVTVPAFCRVVGLATPTSDSRIGIEVWIPAGDWNGKLLGTANGGFGGAVPYPAMAAALARGYAAVGTDTGHDGDQMEFGDGHPEKIADWAWRSVHTMTTVAKLVVRDHLGRFPDRAYFDGCSTGGQQALSEAQRFPADYDGIVAGDPGHNRTRLILGFLWSWMAAHTDDGQPILTPANLSLVARASVQACDAQDGLEDGLLSDPLSCRFDPATIACVGAATDECLTPDQAAAVRKIYDGATNPRTHEQIFPGWVRGSEAGWGTYLVSPKQPARLGFFQYFAFHDPKWDWRTFDWDRDVDFVDAQVPFLSATSSDLGAFKDRGGKLIMYTGWADPVVPPQDTVDYFNAVVQRFGAAGTSSFLRFFPAPGMSHCGGGPGPNSFDALAALDRWVELGEAPDRLVASHRSNGTVDRARPLCAYPSVARYNGAGSIDEASSFTCAAPSPPVR